MSSTTAQRITLGILLAFGVGGESRAQESRQGWRHIADFTDTRGMIEVDGMIATASTRGAALFDPATGVWEHVSLPQGLLSVDLTDVCTDGEGFLFWSGVDASISARSVSGDTWSRGFKEFLEHPQVFTINDLWGAEGSVLVSHSIGLTSFDYLDESDEYLVRWNIQRLGDFAQQTPVLAAIGFGNWLVAVTPQGIAWGEGYPQQPIVFQSMHNPGGLAAIERARLAVGGARLYALLANPDGSAWLGSMDQSGQWQTELADFEDPEGLAASDSGWVMALASGSASRLALGSLGNPVGLPQHTGALVWSDGTLWVALLPDEDGGGLVRIDAGIAGTPIRPSVPGAEEFVDLDFAPDGSLWAVGVAADSKRNGLFHLKADSSWDSWKLGGGWFSNYPTSVCCDTHGGVWFGTWGRGCSRLLPLDSTLTRFSHDAGPMHRMRGFSNAQVGSSETFPLVSDIEEDAAGNIWIVNHQALDDSCLVVVPSAWFADTSIAFARHYFAQSGLNFPFHVESATGASVWVGVAGKDSRDENKRLLQLSSRGLPVSRFAEWRMDNHQLANASWNFGLESQGTISGLRMDPTGNLWVATSDGFYLGGIYGGIAQFSRVQFLEGLLSENLNSLDLDGRGRVWLGSEVGLNVFEPRRSVFQDPVEVGGLNALLHNQGNFSLNKICIDQHTGAIWVASNLGLFMCPTGAVNYGASPTGSARMYPNPFRPDGVTRARILREGLANDAMVTLYSLDGRKVRQLSLLETEQGWDGRDENGAFVASGVYLVLVTSEGGSAEGKIAVIH